MPRLTYSQNREKEGTLVELRQKKRNLCRLYAQQITKAIRKDDSNKCGHVLTDDTTIGLSKHRISAECDSYIQNCFQQFWGEWRGLEKTCKYNGQKRLRNSRKKKTGPVRTMNEAMKTFEILRQSGVEMENMLIPNQKEKNRRRIDTLLARLDAL